MKKLLEKKIFKLIIIALCCVICLGATFTIGMNVGSKVMTQSSIVKVKDPTYNILDEVINILSKSFYFGEDSKEYRSKLLDEAIRDVVDGQGDIHSYYMSKEEALESETNLQGSYVGIGVTAQNLITGILVTKVNFSSPAELAGIIPGDLIVGIDGISTNERSFDDNIAAVRGEEGTSVTLTILRDNKELEITVIRGVIHNTVDTVINGSTATVTISQFAADYDEKGRFIPTTANELGESLKRIKQANCKDLIIDLRDDGGGYLATLLYMCGYFIDADTTVLIENERDAKYEDKPVSQTMYNFDHLIVLINENTASAAEAFTMALKENAGAIVVGVNSYGKNIGQRFAEFYDGSVLRYTYMNWTSGKGVDIGNGGIEPDYYVELDEALMQPILILEDDQVYKYDSVSDVMVNAQKLLKFLGYDVDRVDGYFSKATLEALKKFQTDNQLEVTGCYDKETSISLTQAVISEYNAHLDIYDKQMKKALELINGK